MVTAAQMFVIKSQLEDLLRIVWCGFIWVFSVSTREWIKTKSTTDGLILKLRGIIVYLQQERTYQMFVIQLARSDEAESSLLDWLAVFVVIRDSHADSHPT